jgi:hypothetical protein
MIFIVFVFLLTATPIQWVFQFNRYVNVKLFGFILPVVFSAKFKLDLFLHYSGKVHIELWIKA